MENKDVTNENKNIKSKISIADVIANAAKLAESSKVKKTQLLHSQRLENIIGSGGIEVESVSNAVLYEGEYNKDNKDGMFFAGLYIDPTYVVSKAIISPELCTQDVRKAFGVKTNKELLKKIFSEDEITEIASAVLALKGGAFSIENELKN
ncbi:MAG: phage tail assembly chaperone [Cetobacterium sp.]|uniref:phage tail assembly chaperone n=1 Tax=Cetobacterium sp. TaxID=2071632 RepID=UPI003EE67558